jgi:hypothetical protein
LETQITILGREPAVYVSTFFNEIVTCRLPDGSVRRLLAKRGGVHTAPTYGHRGGVPYEARVYCSVLKPLATSTPRFYGAERDADTGETTLLIEYLENARRLQSILPPMLADAARWIGAFHRSNELRVATLRRWITCYDASYYLGWMHRTLELCPPVHHPWLQAVSRNFEALTEEIMATPVTIIHGEYYPHNILVLAGVIAPVDWESTAIAPGEIDLAGLTEGWSDEIHRDCESEYRSARWPEGAPAEFDRHLGIAGAYLLFRWLGDRAEWVMGERGEWRFASLRRLVERLGML